MGDESTPQANQPSEMELLRAEVRAGFAEMRAGFESAGSRLDGLDTRLDGHDKRFDAMDARITTTAEDTRRHMDVVAEGLRESFKAVIDQTVATGKKVDRLIASNAVEHAAFQEFVTDHEVRITRLEAKPDQDPESPITPSA